MTSDNDKEVAIEGHTSRNHRFLGLDWCWWGWQASRWRWHGTHIDVGPFSVYEIGWKSKWLWFIVAFLIMPMRWGYHTFEVGTTYQDPEDWFVWWCRRQSCRVFGFLWNDGHEFIAAQDEDGKPLDFFICDYCLTETENSPDDN